MNQIILIGEVAKVRELKNKDAVLTITTKDYEKNKIDINILIEQGYEKEMIDILKNKPLLAVKAGLRKSAKDNYLFVAEKMSVLRLSEVDEEEAVEEEPKPAKKGKKGLN
jgi:hypothetical protein